MNGVFVGTFVEVHLTERVFRPEGEDALGLNKLMGDSALKHLKIIYAPKLSRRYSLRIKGLINPCKQS